jgi:hypothetical protein
LTIKFADEVMCKNMVLFRVLREWCSQNEGQKILLEKEETNSSPGASSKAQAPEIPEDRCDFDWINLSSWLFPLAATKSISDQPGSIE